MCWFSKKVRHLVSFKEVNACIGEVIGKNSRRGVPFPHHDFGVALDSCFVELSQKKAGNTCGVFQIEIVTDTVRL